MFIKTIAALGFGLALCAACAAAPREAVIQLEHGPESGALVLPDASAPAPVLLLLAQDGQAGALRPLALALADRGVASLRPEGHGGAAWIARLKRDARFNKVVVVGYAGALLPALQAANQVGADGFVALATDGTPDAATEFGKLHMHARIVQGDADAEAGVEGARRLEQGRPGTPVVMVHGMNHALQAAGATDVAPELVEALVSFANKR